MQTGIHYPTIELAGTSYELSITREILLYRLSRKGVSMADLRGAKGFAALHDILHAIIQDRYQGTVEDLVTLVQSEGKLQLLDTTIAEVVKKAFPPPQPAQAAATDTAPSIQ